MIAPDVPSTCVGMRGLVGLRRRAADRRRSTCTAACGAGPSPTRPVVAARLVAALHDDDGRVTLPGLLRRASAP